MNITVSREGRRSYIVGQTYAAKDAIKAAGGHWDGDRRAWWLGSHETATALVERLSASPAQDDAALQQDRLVRDRSNIMGRATYQGRTYYIVGEGRSERGPWLRLLFRDGSRTFFAASSEVEVIKMYRETMTLAAIQRYAERMKDERVMGECSCDCHGSSDDMGSGGLAKFDGCDRCGCEEDG